MLKIENLTIRQAIKYMIEIVSSGGRIYSLEVEFPTINHIHTYTLKYFEKGDH